MRQSLSYQIYYRQVFQICALPGCMQEAHQRDSSWGTACRWQAVNQLVLLLLLAVLLAPVLHLRIS